MSLKQKASLLVQLKTDLMVVKIIRADVNGTFILSSGILWKALSLKDAKSQHLAMRQV